MQGKEVFRSSDGGTHWKRRSATILDDHEVGRIPASGHVDGLVAVSSTRAYLGLDRATQLQTTDGGRTWTESFTSGDDAGGGPVNFVDSTHGWGRADLHLYRTVDGIHWADLGGGHS